MTNQRRRPMERQLQWNFCKMMRARRSAWKMVLATSQKRACGKHEPACTACLAVTTNISNAKPRNSNGIFELSLHQSFARVI
mmetsp:Transcript_9872/g.60154  ORF Transcript_9872/g.60154 Transcript_9872/m.60154 type:complete len:82 (+) Transcript_9872:3279-3524(+)